MASSEYLDNTGSNFRFWPVADRGCRMAQRPGGIDPLPTFTNGGNVEMKECPKTYQDGSCRLRE